MNYNSMMLHIVIQHSIYNYVQHHTIVITLSFSKQNVLLYFILEIYNQDVKRRMLFK